MNRQKLNKRCRYINTQVPIFGLQFFRSHNSERIRRRWTSGNPYTKVWWRLASFVNFSLFVNVFFIFSLTTINKFIYSSYFHLKWYLFLSYTNGETSSQHQCQLQSNIYVYSDNLKLLMLFDGKSLQKMKIGSSHSIHTQCGLGVHGCGKKVTNN